MAQQSYCSGEKRFDIHINGGLKDLKDALESIRMNLRWYIGDYNTSLFKQLKGTECSSGFMELIKQLIDNKKVDEIISSNYLELQKIADAIALDQKHDFEDTRCNLSNCVNFPTTSLSSISEKIKGIISDNNSGVKPLKGNNELLPEKYSVDMGPQSVYAKNIRYAIDKINNDAGVYCGKINTVSQIIDAAGCDTNCKKDVLSKTIDIEVQFYIYNIGFIFYQGFFEFFKQAYTKNGKKYKYSVLFGKGGTATTIDPMNKNRLQILSNKGTSSTTSNNIVCEAQPSSNGNELTDLKKQVYLFIYSHEVIGDKLNTTMVAKKNVNVGSSGFSVENICKFINGSGSLFDSSFKSTMDKELNNFDPDVKTLFYITLPMCIKGYGDSGQMITTIVMSCSSTLCEGKYTNKIILMTCDTFFMQLLYLFKCPFLLGTRSTPCYLYDESSKLRGKLAVNFYNDTYGNVKIVLNGIQKVPGYNTPDIPMLLQVEPPVKLPKTPNTNNIAKGMSYNIPIMESIRGAVLDEIKRSTEKIKRLYVIVPYGNSESTNTLCLIERSFFSSPNKITRVDSINGTQFYYLEHNVNVKKVYQGDGNVINEAKDVFDRSLSNINGLVKLFTFVLSISFKRELYENQAPYLFETQFEYFMKQFFNNMTARSKGIFESFKNYIDGIDILLTFKKWNQSYTPQTHPLSRQLNSLNKYLNNSFETQSWMKIKNNCFKPSNLVKKSLEECDEMLDYYIAELELTKGHLKTILSILDLDAAKAAKTAKAGQGLLNESSIRHLCMYAIVLLDYAKNIYEMSNMYSGIFLKNIEVVTTFINDSAMISLFGLLKDVREGTSKYMVLTDFFSVKYSITDIKDDNGNSINMCIDHYLQFADCFNKLKIKVENQRTTIMPMLYAKITDMVDSNITFGSKKDLVQGDINIAKHIIEGIKDADKNRFKSIVDGVKNFQFKFF